MTGPITAQAGTALSPEWDRGFDEAFNDLVTSDPDLVRDEFDAIIGANFGEPPEPPGPPGPAAAEPARSQPPPDDGRTGPAPAADRNADAEATNQRSPPE